MFVYWLYILFNALMSIAIGACFAYLLRDLYLQLDDPDDEAPAETPVVVRKSAVLSPANTAPMEEPPVVAPESPDTLPGDAIPPEPEALPDGVSEPQADTEEENRPDPVEATALPESLQVDHILENMLEEKNPEVPADLSSRLEEDEANLEDRLPTFEDEDDASFDFEDDILARAMEQAGGATDPSPEEIDFGAADFRSSVSDEAATSSAIAPTAAEILGEDFNFDQLLDPTPDTIPDAGPSTDRPAFSDAPAEGVYREETAPFLPDSALLERLSGKLDVVPRFPPEMIQDALVAPDRSEAARKLEFVEESRPMFVRKSRPVVGAFAD